jgi:hypothetical protein
MVWRQQVGLGLYADRRSPHTWHRRLSGSSGDLAGASTSLLDTGGSFDEQIERAGS